MIPTLITESVLLVALAVAVMVSPAVRRWVAAALGWVVDRLER